jgi:hypothetical protein
MTLLKHVVNAQEIVVECAVSRVELSCEAERNQSV